MSDPCSRCDRCGNVTEPFWSLYDRHYCRTCVAKARGINVERIEPVTHPLFEEVQFGFRGALISLWSGLVLTGILSGMIFAFFVAINVISLQAPNPMGGNNWQRFANAIPFFAGFCFVFLGVIAIPFGMIYGWIRRPRKISTDGDAFLIETAFETTRLPFADCLWTTPTLACDTSGYYLPSQRLVVIVSTDSHKPISFACGFTPETFQIWKTFASLRRLPFKHPTPLLSWAFWLGGGAVGGGTLGLLAGIVTSALTGIQDWIVICGFTGFLDGSIWGLIRSIVKNSSPAILRNGVSNRQLGWAYYALALPLGGFTIGMKIGRMGGLHSALAMGAVNAVVFAVISRDCALAARQRMETQALFTKTLESNK